MVWEFETGPAADRPVARGVEGDRDDFPAGEAGELNRAVFHLIARSARSVRCKADVVSVAHRADGGQLGVESPFGGGAAQAGDAERGNEIGDVLSVSGSADHCHGTAACGARKGDREKHESVVPGDGDRSRRLVNVVEGILDPEAVEEPQNQPEQPGRQPVDPGRKLLDASEFLFEKTHQETPIFLQMSERVHSPQRGFPAGQTRRPC